MLSFESLPSLEPGFGFSPWDSTNSNPIEDKTQNVTAAYEPDRTEPISLAEERRLRRMISNRESARRSRMRKQRHLEDLRLQASRLRSENRELASRLGAVSNHALLFRSDNDRLRAESAVLRHRLSEIRRFLLFSKLQKLSSPAAAAVMCGGFASGTAQTGSSIIA